MPQKTCSILASLLSRVRFYETTLLDNKMMSHQQAMFSFVELIVILDHNHIPTPIHDVPNQLICPKIIVEEDVVEMV